MVPLIEPLKEPLMVPLIEPLKEPLMVPLIEPLKELPNPHFFGAHGLLGIERPRLRALRAPLPLAELPEVHAGEERLHCPGISMHTCKLRIQVFLFYVFLFRYIW